MSDYPGRIMTKAPRLPSTTQASGIWTLQQALQAIKAGVWPGIPTNTVILSFTSSGSWTCPDGVSQVDYLVVAGGGGGAVDYGGVGIVTGKRIAKYWKRWRWGGFQHWIIRKRRLRHSNPQIHRSIPNRIYVQRHYHLEMPDRCYQR